MNMLDPTGLTCIECCCCPLSVSASDDGPILPGMILGEEYYGELRKVAASSYGTKVTTAILYENKFGPGGACKLSYIETASIRVGSIIPVAGTPVEQYGREGTKYFFRSFDEALSKLDKECPKAAGFASLFDPPLTPLRSNADDRTLCIEIHVTGGCKACAHVPRVYVKQVCKFNNGTPGCTVTISQRNCRRDAGNFPGIDIYPGGPHIIPPFTP